MIIAYKTTRNLNLTVMKKILLLFLFMGIALSHSQTIKIEQNENLHLTLNKDRAYIVKDVRNKGITEPLSKKNTIDVKRNSVDIYVNWINPLQYKLVLRYGN